MVVVAVEVVCESAAETAEPGRHYLRLEAAVLDRVERRLVGVVEPGTVAGREGDGEWRESYFH